MTHDEIFEEFKAWSPEHAKLVIYYKPWGSNSIVIWFNADTAYKVKRISADRFIMQPVSKDDIKKKFNL